MYSLSKPKSLSKMLVPFQGVKAKENITLRNARMTLLHAYPCNDLGMYRRNPSCGSNEATVHTRTTNGRYRILTQ